MGIEADVSIDFGGYPWSVYPNGFTVAGSSIGRLVLTQTAANLSVTAQVATFTWTGIAGTTSQGGVTVTAQVATFT